ncbi:MAG: MerR family transcriptional regulator [Bermanella sp.]
MYIGELSQCTGATPRAIRLYESLNLIQVARKGNYRVYETAHIEFVQLIKEAQSLGISLAELQLLKKGDNDLDWSGVNALLTIKKEQSEDSIRKLNLHISRLERYQALIADCVKSNAAHCE